jgi:hypothetical protein
MITSVVPDIQEPIVGPDGKMTFGFHRFLVELVNDLKALDARITDLEP